MGSRKVPGRLAAGIAVTVIGIGTGIVGAGTALVTPPGHALDPSVVSGPERPAVDG